MFKIKRRNRTQDGNQVSFQEVSLEMRVNVRPFDQMF